MSKISRNDPCPCGSGKKYKQCCLPQANTPPLDDHADAVPKAIDWLMEKHGPAAREALDETFFSGLDEEQFELLETLPEDAYASILWNGLVWLLADGEIILKKQERRVSELLFARGGPLLSAAQRRWLEALVSQPLRLYEISDLVRGEKLQLRDVLDSDKPPVWVREKSGSEALSLYDLIGARIVPFDDHFELSGEVYDIPRDYSWDLIEELRHELKDLPPDEAEIVRDITGIIITSYWLDLYLTPVELPELVDKLTGEPILLITDHYRVTDWEALDTVLSSQADIEGNRTEGWERVFEADDGLTRSKLVVNLGQQPDRIEVFYRTQNYADEGRPWFEALVGDAVAFFSRELSDPKGMLANREATEAPADTASDIPPETMTEIFQQHIYTLYRDWADQPLPVLEDRTPRETITTPEGLEQVKFLLHTYEHSEARLAKDQQREPVSYDFLWDALGIEK